MTNKEKEKINNWLDNVYKKFYNANSYIKYPCSKLGYAMDILLDTICDFPINLE